MPLDRPWWNGEGGGDVDKFGGRKQTAYVYAPPRSSFIFFFAPNFLRGYLTPRPSDRTGPRGRAGGLAGRGGAVRGGGVDRVRGLPGSVYQGRHRQGHPPARRQGLSRTGSFFCDVSDQVRGCSESLSLRAPVRPREVVLEEKLVIHLRQRRVVQIRRH